jgi:hypothetical protein
MIAAAAIGVALGGAGVAYAAGSSGSTSTTTPGATSPTTTPGSNPGKFPGPRGFGFKGFGGGVVHGQFTVSDGNGGYRTELVQTGKASAVSPGSITVTSADGYKHTYTVTATTVVDSQRDGIGSVASGDQVEVTASSASGKDTATDIIDSTKLQSSAKANGWGEGHGPGPFERGSFVGPAVAS